MAANHVSEVSPVVEVVQLRGRQEDYLIGSLCVPCGVLARLNFRMIEFQWYVYGDLTRGASMVPANRSIGSVHKVEE